MAKHSRNPVVVVVPAACPHCGHLGHKIKATLGQFPGRPVADPATGRIYTGFALRRVQCTGCGKYYRTRTVLPQQEQHMTLARRSRKSQQRSGRLLGADATAPEIG